MTEPIDEEIEAIRAKLLSAERSGFTDQSVDQIWEAARNEPPNLSTATPNLSP